MSGRRLAYGLLVLPIICSLSGCGGPNMKADPRDSQYSKLIDAKYDVATKALDEDLKKNPDSLPAQYYRAVVEVESGNLQDGLDRLNKIIEKYPNYSFAYSERARANIKAIHFDQALADANEAIRQRPDVARNFIRRAMAYLFMHKPEQALADLDQAHKIDPKEDANYVQLLRGGALYDSHHYQQAADCFTAVLSKGKDIRAYIKRSLCYGRLKEWDKAMADANTAGAMDPKDVDAKALHAAILSGEGKRADARKEFAALIKAHAMSVAVADGANLGPNVPSVADAAFAALELKNPKYAKEILERTQSHRPLDGDENLAVAKVEIADGDFFRAAKHLNECLATEPTWGEARVELIKLYVKDKLPDKARAVQKEGLQLQLSAEDRKLVSSAI